MPYGGELVRLIKHSLFRYIESGLTDLNYFSDTDAYKAWVFTEDQISDDQVLTTNTIALSFEGMLSSEIEVGSNATEVDRFAYLDVYPENRSLGEHMAGDLVGILEGKMPHIGKTSQFFPVVDWSISSGQLLFHAEMVEPLSGLERDYGRPYQRNWYTVGFRVRYGDFN